ncbi:MAG: hypothetical protein MJ252_12185 [archaeon]|nr:hypothetical protein [archaeon]
MGCGCSKNQGTIKISNELKNDANYYGDANNSNLNINQNPKITETKKENEQGQVHPVNSTNKVIKQTSATGYVESDNGNIISNGQTNHRLVTEQSSNIMKNSKADKFDKRCISDKNITGLKSKKRLSSAKKILELAKIKNNSHPLPFSSSTFIRGSTNAFENCLLLNQTNENIKNEDHKIKTKNEKKMLNSVILNVPEKFPKQRKSSKENPNEFIFERLINDYLNKEHQDSSADSESSSQIIKLIEVKNKDSVKDLRDEDKGDTSDKEIKK